MKANNNDQEHEQQLKELVDIYSRLDYEDRLAITQLIDLARSAPQFVCCSSEDDG